MQRRQALALAASGMAGALAGCLNFGAVDAGRRPVSTTEAGSWSAPSDIELPIPESELVRGASKDGIPAITEPVFGTDWRGLEIEVRNEFGVEYTTRPRLEPADRVVGVVRDGAARAYPLKVLNWHEVVNDTLDGPLLVTYCPLCGSAVTAVRAVNGEETVFGVSGYLFRNDLVMYDAATESLWSQILATAINGPETGETLDLVPSALTTWSAWREAHPDTRVLRPPPESNTVLGRGTPRDYDRNPYSGYDQSQRIGLGDEYTDDRLHPKTTVIGISHAGVARAYPLEAVREADVVNDEVGGLAVVVTVAPGDSLVAYERTVDGTTVPFKAATDATLRAGGSRWRRATGEALDGRYEGTQLQPATHRSPMFFFAWRDFNRETEVYGTE